MGFGRGWLKPIETLENTVLPFFGKIKYVPTLMPCFGSVLPQSARIVPFGSIDVPIEIHKYNLSVKYFRTKPNPLVFSALRRKIDFPVKLTLFCQNCLFFIIFHDFPEMTTFRQT